jgi:hypothetical protein
VTKQIGVHLKLLFLTLFWAIMIYFVTQIQVKTVASQREQDYIAVLFQMFLISNLLTWLIECSSGNSTVT